MKDETGGDRIVQREPSQVGGGDEEDEEKSVREPLTRPFSDHSNLSEDGSSTYDKRLLTADGLAGTKVPKSVQIVAANVERRSSSSRSATNSSTAVIADSPNVHALIPKDESDEESPVVSPEAPHFDMDKPITTGEMWDLVPPDGGWGWLVLAGSMLVNILIPGTIKSFGVLFVEFVEAFETTPAQAAWIPALCYFLYSSLGPLSSILSVKYSYRTVTIMGGAFAAVGMMTTFWASSISYLYVSYGIMVGIGAGLAFPPTVYIVTSYFVRLRGLANGLCISGSALGSIILPPVLRYLLETYGYRGAVLLMGGVTLNVWVAAIFYEPVENHLKRVPALAAPPAATGNGVGEKEDEDGIVLDFGGDGGPREEKRAKFAITSGTETPPMPMGTPKLTIKSPEFYRVYQENGFVRSASAVVVRNYSRGSNMDGEHNPHGHSHSTRSRKISAPGKPEGQQVQDMSSSPSLYVLEEGKSSSHRLHRFHPSRMTTSSGRLTKRSPSTSSFNYISTPYHGSTLSALQPTDFASHISLKSITNAFKGGKDQGDTVAALDGGEGGARGGGKVGSESSGEAEQKNKYFDLSLLRDPTYLVILISNSTNAISYTNFIILLPTYAIALGYDKSLAAYLLSIVSAFDLVGRIGGSALSDTELIPKTWYFIGGLAISGFSLAVLPFTTDYLMLSVFCSLFGLASGVYVGITAVIMADMLGTERLTSTYGISLFVNGILQLIGPPLCGVWYEQVLSHAPLFTTFGFILLLGASLWGVMPFINRRKRRQEAMARARECGMGHDLTTIVEDEKNGVMT